jgi:hypothetical protein
MRLTWMVIVPWRVFVIEDIEVYFIEQRARFLVLGQQIFHIEVMLHHHRVIQLLAL